MEATNPMNTQNRRKAMEYQLLSSPSSKIFSLGTDSSAGSDDRVLVNFAGAANGGFQDDDVLIVQAVRTPITKAKKGGLRDSTPDDLLDIVFQSVLQRARISPHDLGDICVGNVLQFGAGGISSRVAQFRAGIPETVPLHTVNRQCSSGLQAVASVAAGIKSGFYGVGMAAGVECMSLTSMSGNKIDLNMEEIKKCPLAASCLTPMGITSENVAQAYGISREQQDEFSALSHQRAAAAQARGDFREEVVAVKVLRKGEEGEAPKEEWVTEDDGIRATTTADKLAKLKPVFKKGGSTTAGNSSQVSDGAAAVLLMSGAEGRRRGVVPLGVLRSYAVVGVPPEVMGIGPAYAIPAALEKAGITTSDVGVFEINEAFASQATYCVQYLGLPLEKVNPLGGAIALGHPLGCTGARQVATILHYMKNHRIRYGVVSMCIGTGMGAAAVFECTSNPSSKL